MKICFYFTNSADPDEMPHCATFHQDLHCLQKNLFAGIHNEKFIMSILGLNEG